MTTQEILEAARGAKAALALADGTSRAQALCSMAAQLCSPANMTAILAANADDMAAAKGHISEVMLDRLALTEERIRAMAKGIEEVAALPDPVGRVLKRVEQFTYTAALSTAAVNRSASACVWVRMASLWPVECCAMWAMASSTLSTTLTARM